MYSIQYFCHKRSRFANYSLTCSNTPPHFPLSDVLFSTRSQVLLSLYGFASMQLAYVRADVNFTSVLH